MGHISNGRETRAARNQSMFRQINEKLTRNDPLADLTGSYVITCECADPTCVRTLGISVSDYETMREGPRQFVVLPGHIYPEVERVISIRVAYVVVEKLGRAAEVAEELAPEHL